MDNKSEKSSLIVGRLGSPHGIRGWIKVTSYTDPPENILTYQPWQLILADKQKTVTVTSSRLQGHRIVALIEGCQDRDTAALLTGAEISIDRTQLKPLAKNEYYWTDLVGLIVVTPDEQVLGKVEEIFSTGSNDVVVVKGTKKYLIPFLLDRVILEIDLEHKRMKVDWDPNF